MTKLLKAFALAWILSETVTCRSFGQATVPVRWIGTVAELVQRRPSVGEAVLVSGMNAPGDFQGDRLFYGTNAVPFGATNLAHSYASPSADRWWASTDAGATQKLEWWGGFPDDSTDDSAAIQAWHDGLEGRVDPSDGWTNAIGGRLMIPAGNLLFTNRVTITNLCEIVGAGRGRTVINVTGSNDGFYVHIPWFSGPYAWSKLEGFTLQKDLALQSGKGIVQEWNGSMVLIDDVGVQGFYDGVELKGWVSHLQRVTSRQNGRHGFSVPNTLPAGINPTHIRFEFCESQSNLGNGFDVENSSYIHFTSCVSEWHTNGIGWRFATADERGVFASQNSTTLINCSSEMDHEAAVFRNCHNVIWYGGMMLPRVPGQGNESTNIVRFIGPNQVRLDRINTEMGYTPTFGGYTVFCEDLGYGWPHLVEINGGSWRRMLLGRENRPGTVKWNTQWTMPTSFPILGASQTGFTNIEAGSVGFDLETAGQTIGTNDFSILLDVTWPDYVGSSEILAHVTTGGGWNDANAFFLQLNADSKLEIATYNGDSSANRLQAKGTNTLMAFSGQRAKILVSRAANDGARMWIGGKRIKLQEYETGAGGSFSTNDVAGSYLHFGNRLAGTRWLYHGGALLNYAVTDDAEALGIVDHGPTALLPWATFGDGTNGVVLNWSVGPNGDWRDGSPNKIPAHEFGSIRVYGKQAELWRSYGIDKVNVTNSTASTTIQQLTGTAPGTLVISNGWGGTTWSDSLADSVNKTSRLGMGNYDGTGTMPLGLIGGSSYSGGGDVNFGGYNTVLLTKPSGYYWAFGSSHDDVDGWLGMAAGRGTGFHVINPATIRVGTNVSTVSSNGLVSFSESQQALQLIAPVGIDFWPGYLTDASATNRTARMGTLGLSFDANMGLIFYGENPFTNIGAGLAISGGKLVATGSGSGDVTGPGSATDNAVVRFDGTTGDLIQNSVVTIDDSGNVAGVGTLALSGPLTLDGTNILDLITSGGGDVFGPGVTTDKAIAVWNGTGGNAIQNSVAILDPATGDLSGIGTLAITGPLTQGGTNVFDLIETKESEDADLTAVAGLSGTGLIVRTGSGTAATRTITGDSEIAVADGDGVSGNPTLSIGSAIARDAEVAAAYEPLIGSTPDWGGKTSFEIPNGASPTVDAFGEIAGDNDAWSSGRGAPVWFDGTGTAYLVGVQTSDTPSDGQVPVWNTGGTITWEDQSAGVDEAADYDWTGTHTFASVTITNLTIESLTLGSAIGVGSGGTGATTASDARDNLGLTIGSDVQAYDADLSGLAGLTWATGVMAYHDGASIAALASTSYGRGVLSGASYQAIRDLVNEGANPPAYSYGLTVHSAVTNWVADMRFPVLTMTASADVNLIHATNKPSIATNVYGTVLQITGDTQDRTLTWNSTWNAVGGVTSATIRSNEVTLVSIMAPGPNETDVVIGVPSSGAAAATAGTATVGRFFAPQAHYPASGAAYFGYRSSVPVGVFVDGSETHFRFMGVFPEGFTSTAVTVVVRWASDATSGNGIWGAKIWNLSDSDVDTETFDTAVEHTDATSGTAGATVTSTLASVGIDSATAGDAFILDVYRAGDDASDTLSNVAHGVSVEVLAE